MSDIQTTNSREKKLAPYRWHGVVNVYLNSRKA